MPAPSIRAATPDDIEEITAIYADAVTHGTASYELSPPSAADMSERQALLLAKSYPYLVAEIGGKVAGYAYAGPFRPRPAYRFTVENSVYVAPAQKGRGIGRHLLSALIGECTRLGFRQMVAVIGDGTRQSASIGLHTSLGFRHAGAIEGTGYKHGRWLDTVFMQLEMNKGIAAPPDPDSLAERLFRG